MDVVEVIKSRKSIRAFKPDPVPLDTLKQIIGLAVRAPSWSNTQPWEFVIAGGRDLKAIESKSVERDEQDQAPDIARAEEFPEPYNTRRRGLTPMLLEIKGIKREDKEGRRWWRMQGERHFGAPVVIYVCIARALYFQKNGINSWPLFDCGLVSENIMLLAAAYGLGTIVQARAAYHPDIVREVLRIPDSKLVVMGISVGYPDWDDPVNQLHSEREPLENVVTWRVT